MFAKYFSVLVTVAIAASPIAAADVNENSVIAKLIGAWTYSSGVKNGETLGADHFKGQSIEFTKKTVTLKSDETFVLNYELDEAKTPMSIKLTITEGPFGEGESTVGILEIKDDALRLCYPARGGAVPSKFAAGEGTGNHLFTLSRSEAGIDPAKLVGTWQYSSGKKDGEELEEDHFAGQSVVITKDTFTLKSEETFVMKYELDTKQSPVSIKFTITESPFGAGATANGILQLKAGQLHVCYAPRGGEAPSKFDAAADSGHFLFSLKRQ